jgi:hypothetical protein
VEEWFCIQQALHNPLDLLAVLSAKKMADAPKRIRR